MPDRAFPDTNYQKTLLVGASTGVVTDGPVSLWADKVTHRLLVDAGTITTSSATAGLTGAAVPTSADYIGISVGGTLTGLTAGQATMANSIPVVIASNQTGIPVTGTFFQSTQPVSLASLPALIAGSAIIGKVTTDQTTHGTTDLVAADITKVGGSSIALGQTTMANSFPVVLASNQASIPVAATLAAETTKVIGTVNIAASQTVGLVAGAALIGKVGIDQTTPGTTNLVALAANQSVNLAQVGAASIALGQTTMANSLPVAIASNQGAIALWGHGATGAAVPANAGYNGAQARSSEITALTNGQLAGLVADLVGKLIVLPYANPENFVNGTTAAITDTTSTSTIAAQGAGIRTYVTQITVTNSHATVGTFVKILDGASIIHEGYAAAAGGGYTATFPTPLRGTANTAINTQPVTTGANVIASVSGYKGI